MRVKIIKAHPYVGIGVGNYVAGTAEGGTQAVDPHEVLLLQAAEGRLPSSPLLSSCWSLGLYSRLRRMRRVDVAVAAAGVFVATVAHGLIDVYWVRGTPVLSWLLVGMACGGLARMRQQAARG